MKTLHGRAILVTGASRGIGRAAARELLSRGAEVIGTARSLAALEDAAMEFGPRFSPVAAEMADKASLEALAAMVARRFGRLDGLFGNAGILGTKTPVGSLDDDDFLRTAAINITSSYRLLHLFDPLLRRSEAGRVLFVTSGVAWKRHAGWTLYAISKASIEAMVGVYAHETADTAIRANLISPGPIRTEMRVEAWPEEDPATVPLPEAVAPVIADLLGPDTAESGAIYDFPLGRWTHPQRPA
jgi:NAD(P)-dependent dehydrogenase (short-subunit alcohol dehydrogenase family)